MTRDGEGVPRGWSEHAWREHVWLERVGLLPDREPVGEDPADVRAVRELEELRQAWRDGCLESALDVTHV